MNDARLVEISRSSHAIFCTLILLGTLGLTSCGSGSSSPSDTPADSSDEQLSAADEAEDLDVLGTLEDDPDSDNQVVVGGSLQVNTLSQAGRVGLVVATVQRCAVVYKPLEIVITRKPGEAVDSDDYPNVTDLVKFDRSLGTSLKLVSRTNGRANFEMSAQDIVALTATIENGAVTTFLAGYERDSPSSFIMRKRVANGCLYAFKSEDYCVTGLAKSGSLSFSRNGVSMSAAGCELENPDSLPVLEVQ